MSIESVIPSNHLIICRPLLLPPSIFPNIRVFSSKSVLRIRWPKYWSFSFSISPSNDCSGLILYRMDSLDLLAVQGTLKSLLQHHSSKASILWHLAFFMVQLSHPYICDPLLPWVGWTWGSERPETVKVPGSLLGASILGTPGPWGEPATGLQVVPRKGPKGRSRGLQPAPSLHQQRRRWVSLEEGLTGCTLTNADYTLTDLDCSPWEPEPEVPAEPS